MTVNVERKLNHQIGKLLVEKLLIKSNDRILVGLSGGKDSWTMVHFLHEFQKKAPVKFELIVLTLDVGFTKEHKSMLITAMNNYASSYIIYPNSIVSIIEEKREPNSSYCAFCARLRRGHLYKAATENHCNKIALGHHKDDFVETILMNLFFHGCIKGMPALFTAKETKHQVIRPLLYCLETDIAAFAAEKEFPLLACPCGRCGIQDGQRKNMKRLLSDMEQRYPGVKSSMMTAANNIHNDHMI